MNIKGEKDTKDAPNGHIRQKKAHKGDIKTKRNKKKDQM